MSEKAEAEVIKPAKGLGKVMIELDLDHRKMNYGFTNVDTAKLLKPIEINNLFDPFYADCIINELMRRAGQSIVAAAPKIIVDIRDLRKQ